jgi:hypothetical protein
MSDLLGGFLLRSCIPAFLHSSLNSGHGQKFLEATCPWKAWNLFSMRIICHLKQVVLWVL